MPHVRWTTFRATPGRRDDLVALLTRPGPGLGTIGCLAYEVGTRDDEPDTVLVCETWTSAIAHRESLALDAVRAAIKEAAPLLADVPHAEAFDAVGSPLRT